MLKKLLKYDLKWNYKPLLVFYILSLFFAALTRICLNVENSIIINIIGKIFSGVTISMMINILINNFLRLWARFTKNIYKDESYLTHTLPVKKETIYLSKILAGIITMFTSVLVIILSIVICYYNHGMLEFIKTSLEVVATSYNSTIFRFLFVSAFVIFLEVSYILQIGYLGIIIGHKSNKNKMLKSIIYGFVLYMVSSTVSLGILLIAGIFNNEIMNLFNTVDVVKIETIKTTLYIAIGIYMAFWAIAYLIGKKLLKKGVNVD